jgi:hypothetical protein
MDDYINYDAKLPGFVGKKTDKKIVPEDNVLARIVTISLKGDVSSSKIGLTMRQAFLGKSDWAKIDEKILKDDKGKKAKKEETQEPEEQEYKTEEPETLEESQPKEESEEIKLINQGAYGCIVKPQIECDENEYDSKNYVSKIQEVSFELQKEIKIGEEIQQIANYFNYFAPILKSCNVSLNERPYDIDKNCKIMKNSLGEKHATKTYVSNKIRYVGKYDLGKIIKMTETKKKLPRFEVKPHF